MSVNGLTVNSFYASEIKKNNDRRISFYIVCYTDNASFTLKLIPPSYSFYCNYINERGKEEVIINHF